MGDVIDISSRRNRLASERRAAETQVEYAPDNATYIVLWKGTIIASFARHLRAEALGERLYHIAFGELLGYDDLEQAPIELAVPEPIWSRAIRIVVNPESQAHVVVADGATIDSFSDVENATATARRLFEQSFARP